MVKIFTEKLSEVFSLFIPNKIVKFNDKDQPWITPQLKTAIKRKHRIYSKFVQNGRKQEDWNRVKNVQSETSRLIASAKNEYYANLGKMLSDPKTGTKTYWSLFSKLINKKNSPIYRLCLNMVYLLPMWRPKQTFLMIILFLNAVQ